ncbi:hypothetical protein IEQ34_001027 [Dendrobium chrysotoxum]|uniref:Uncharacterized protein n=1 Tax=Dendrobium chrysotoxum TaxID=161865 RepID=A0AAV7H6M8_DENCH|nr:hypothetical protein IEQ34_001027 [Dendrobium chrysotoxum]
MSFSPSRISTSGILLPRDGFDFLLRHGRRWSLLLPMSPDWSSFQDGEVVKGRSRTATGTSAQGGRRNGGRGIETEANSFWDVGCGDGSSGQVGRRVSGKAPATGLLQIEDGGPPVHEGLSLVECLRQGNGIVLAVLVDMIMMMMMMMMEAKWKKQLVLLL